MKHLRAQHSGFELPRFGLGCMRMSNSSAPEDRDESLATIHAAMDAGVTFLNMGDFYGLGHNEMLVGDYGYYQKDAASPRVIVTSGAGTWGMPMRVGTNSEIVNITLR